MYVTKLKIESYRLLKKLTYILLISFVWFTSCETPFDPGDIDQERKFHIQCELTPGEIPTAYIHVTGNVDRTEPISRPKEDIDVDLNGDRVSYSPSLEAFIISSYTIEEGQEYTIDIFDTENNYGAPAASATTVVPFVTEIDSVVITDDLYNQVGNEVVRMIEVDIEIEEPADGNHYFQIIPQILNPSLLNEGTEEYMAIESKKIQILSDETAFVKYIHKNGIFLDIDRLETNTVKLRLEYTALVDVYDLVDHVLFSINTITDETMMFHDQSDREVSLSSLQLDEPITASTNVENGLGLFGSSAKSEYKLEF